MRTRLSCPVETLIQMDVPNRCTPPDLREAANVVREQRLPEKSRDDYLKAYDDFLKWHKMKHVPDGYVTSNVVMAYFKDLSEAYAPSTMASRLSMLKATLMLKNQMAASIDWEPLEKWVYTKRDKWDAKKSAIFTRAQVDAFISLQDEHLLMKKIAFAFGVFGGMRKSEIVALKPSDVSMVDGKLEVKVKDGKTGDRWFIISPTDNAALNVVALCTRYISLRPPGNTPDRFFLRYTNGRCTRQPVGKNMVAEIPAFVANLLKLPDVATYTSHAMRRTGATILADEGCDFLTLKRFGAWKSDKVAQGYVANSKAQKARISDLVQGEKNGKKMKMTAYVPPSTAPPAPLPAMAQLPALNVHAPAAGPTFNFLGSNNHIIVYMMPTGPHSTTVPSPLVGPVAAEPPPDNPADVGGV